MQCTAIYCNILHMLYATVPKKLNGAPKIREDGVYIRYSMEIDTFPRYPGEDVIYPILTTSVKDPEYWYNLIIMMKDDESESFLLRFGTPSCSFWNPVKDLGKLKIKFYRKKLHDRSWRHCTVYRMSDEERAQCDHSNPITDYFQYRDESVQGCRCYIYEARICTCAIREYDEVHVPYYTKYVNRYESERIYITNVSIDGFCKCVHENLPEEDQVEILKVTDFITYFGLSQHECNDPIHVARTFKRQSLKKFRPLVGSGLFDIHKYISPIKDEYACATTLVPDQSDQADPAKFCPDCRELDRDITHNAIKRYLVADSEVEYNRLEDLNRDISHLTAVWTERTESGSIDPCLYCGGSNCLMQLKSFLELYWDTIYCDACGTEKKAFGYIYQTRYKCLECPNYDLCEECHSSPELRHGHTFSRRCLEIDHKDCRSYVNSVCVAYADNLECNDQFYINTYGHEDPDVIYPCFSYDDSHSKEYYFYPLNPDEMVSPQSQKRYDNWIALMLTR